MNPLHVKNLEIDVELDHQAVSSDTKSYVVENISKPRDLFYVKCVAAIAALNSCNLGYDQGVSAGLARSFQRNDPGTWYFSDFKLEMFIGMLSFTAFIGAASAAYVSDAYGRRASFLAAAINFIIGVTLMASAPNYGMIMFGRAITGLGIGLGLAVDPLYISETAPADLRGMLVSCSEIAINVGILLGYITGYAMSGVAGDTQWRVMIALGLPMPCLLLILVLTVLPESPRWLVMKGRKEEAAVILERLNHEDGEKMAQEIEEDLEREREVSALVTWTTILTNPVMRRKVVAGVGTAIAQQATGEEPILYYMLSIFEDAGIESLEEQFGALIVVGLAKVLAIVIAGYLFDRSGRKPLLMGSNLGISFSLILLAGASGNVPVLAFLAVVLYVIAFSCGMGPGAWLIPSEVFTNDIRAKGMSACTVSNRLVALALTSSFLSMRNGMTDAGAYFFFACVALGNCAFFWRFLPETKGRTLENVSELFMDPVKLSTADN